MLRLQSRGRASQVCGLLPSKSKLGRTAFEEDIENGLEQVKLAPSTIAL